MLSKKEKSGFSHVLGWKTAFSHHWCDQNQTNLASGPEPLENTKTFSLGTNTAYIRIFYRKDYWEAIRAPHTNHMITYNYEAI